ncbi:hypothetical protein J6590_063673 [Homalodisca vitripennis]|nr:hypothetical protein J6590_063673 [Homalodisca vitripennis]
MVVRQRNVQVYSDSDENCLCHITENLSNNSDSGMFTFIVTVARTAFASKRLFSLTTVTETWSY